MKFFAGIAVLSSLTLRVPVAPAPDYAQTTSAEPTRVILFIGDGMGIPYWTAGYIAADHLAVQQFKVVGLVDTRSSSHRITDSAAGATAYATGFRTFNGAIGVLPDSQPARTVLEIAQQRGMATGLVATSSIVHATPAAFAAHVPDRNMYPAIAAQMAAQKIDVLLGGGLGFFDGSLRPDSNNLLPEMLTGGGALVKTADELKQLDIENTRHLVGLFAENHMPRAGERHPTLPEMTQAALGVLDKNPNGFFLMVEGSQPDWRGHANEPLDQVTAEVLDFDHAVQVGLDYAKDHPETLIVVLADHETGGLAIQYAPNANYRAGDPPVEAGYTTRSHTGEMIPLFAAGPGAERFGGIIENRRVGRLLIETVRGGAN